MLSARRQMQGLSGSTTFLGVAGLAAPAVVKAVTMTETIMTLKCS